MSDQQLISELIGKCIAYANGANILNKNSAIPLYARNNGLHLNNSIVMSSTGIIGSL